MFTIGEAAAEDWYDALPDNKNTYKYNWYNTNLTIYVTCTNREIQ